MSNNTSQLRVKVGGITEKNQADALEQIGVEFCDFIFYPKSPKYAFRYLPAADIKKIRGKINKVGVFVNAPTDEILEITDSCGLYLAQLHGDESPKNCEKISNYISVIKTFRLSEDDNILWRIKDYKDAVDMFLFDIDTTNYSQAGKKFNLDKLLDLTIEKPFFLSGSVESFDIPTLSEFSKTPVAKDLFAVDIYTKPTNKTEKSDLKVVSNYVTELKLINAA